MIHAERPKIENWLCYYGSKFGPEVYSRFDLVVFDGHYHPPLKRRGNGQPVILGYVSVGEVINNGPLWHLAQDQPYLIRKNQFWDSWMVDVRDPSWRRLLLQTVIPAILKKGFDGLFLDTFDSSLSLLQGEERQRFEGIQAALIDFTVEIKRRFPDTFVALNRGLPLLPGIAEHIDFVVVEDLYSVYSSKEKDYIKVDEYTQKILLEQVHEGLKVNPDLVVLTLDYARPRQRDMIRSAIQFSKKRGFIPYVSTIKLDEIFFHTLKD